MDGDGGQEALKNAPLGGAVLLPGSWLHYLFRNATAIKPAKRFFTFSPIFFFFDIVNNYSG